MQAIVHDAIDNRLFSFARDAWVERKYGAFHETLQVHGHMVLQIREVLDCIVSVHIRVIPVSSTVNWYSA